MFDDLVESTAHRKKTNKSWSVLLSVIVQSLFLGVLILIPLIYTEALPKAMLSTLLDRAPAPATPAAPASAREGRRQAGGPFDPVRQADAAARDPQGSGGF